MILREAYALNAEGALLHDALLAHRHVRIQLLFQRRIPMMIVVVEVADLVGAVHRARARADATVVDLHVETVLVVIGGSHRTDCLARRRLAVLAQHRDEAQLCVRILALPVALDADPLYLAARANACSPTMGRLFSALQAVTQASQPVQRSRSIVMVQA